MATEATPIENFGRLKRRSGRKTAERQTLLVGLQRNDVESQPEPSVRWIMKEKKAMFSGIELDVIARSGVRHWNKLSDSEVGLFCLWRVDMI